MKHLTTTRALLFSVAIFFMLSQSIQAQESLVTSEDLISAHSEELEIFNFIYSPSSKAYEFTCSSTRPISEGEGQLAVFMAFDDSQDFIYLPESEEDLRSLRKGANELSYEIDPMGMIRVVIQNSNGGTPWSTMDVNKIQLKQYFLATNVSPLFEWGMDMEDEETLSSLSSFAEAYVLEQLTTR